MGQKDQYATGSETIRLIAVEELKQNDELSFKAMLDLFYMNTYLPTKEDDHSGKSRQQGKTRSE